MIGFGSAAFFADSKPQRVSETECIWCPDPCPYHSPERIKAPKMTPQRSCLRKSKHGKSQYGINALDSGHNLRRSKSRMARSVRFRGRDEYQAAPTTFRDFSNEPIRTPKPRNRRSVPAAFKPEADPSRPKMPQRRLTLSSLLSAPYEDGSMDAPIIGAPGSLLILGSFAKKRSEIRERHASADKPKAEKKDGSGKHRNIFRRLTAF